MADPFTLVTIIGTAFSAVGQVSAANAAAASSNYNAQIQDRNVVVADQNRQATIQQAALAAEDKRREDRRVLSNMRANYGASGLSLAGSPLDVLTDTSVEQATDQRRVEYEGQVRGREGALQMLGLQEGATLDRMSAASQRSAGVVGAIGTGFSGAGRVLQRTG